MITDAQFSEWLESDSRERVMLVEADWSGLTDPVGLGVNVALTGTAQGSTEHSSGNYGAFKSNNSERAGGGGGGYWQADVTGDGQWLKVTFDQPYLIDRVVVYSVQDNFGAPLEPTDTLVGTLYLLVNFEVQVWNGYEWLTVVEVANNTLIKRTVEFAAYTTSAVRILVHETGDGAVRCTELEAFTPSSSGGTEYLSTHPYVSGPLDVINSQPYTPIVKSIPSFKQAMSDLMIGQTTANKGTVELRGSVDTDMWVFRRNWIGHGLRMFIGDMDWSRDDFRSVWAGVTGNIAVKDTNTVSLETRDLQHLLNQPMKVEAVDAGTNVSQPLPVALGNFYNVPAVLLDEATHKYAISDGPISSFTQVRDRGISVAYTGSPSDGTFTLSALPSGRITVDGVGSLGGSGAILTAADMIQSICVDRSYLTIDDLDMSSFIALKLQCPQPLGLWVNSVGMTAIEAIDQITNTVGAFTAVNRDGQLFVKRFDFDGEPIDEITEADIIDGGLALSNIYAPTREIRIAARKNYSPNTLTQGGVSGASETKVAEFANSHTFFARATNQAQANLPKGRISVRRTPAAPVVVSDVATDDGAASTLFTSQADAQAEANRRLRLWGVQRYLFNVRCRVRPLRLNLGDTVVLQHSRYDLAAGRNAVVVSIDERYGQRTVNLGLLV